MTSEILGIANQISHLLDFNFCFKNVKIAYITWIAYLSCSNGWHGKAAFDENDVFQSKHEKLSSLQTSSSARFLNT